jgi:hypothetical protein
MKALEKYSDKYSDKRAMSKEDDHIRLTRKLQGRSLKKKLSLREEQEEKDVMGYKREENSTKGS